MKSAVRHDNPYVDNDYINETHNFLCGISIAMLERGISYGAHESTREFLRRIGDDALYDAIVETRKMPGGKVHTIQERFLTDPSQSMCLPNSQARRDLEKWVSDHPDRVNQTNAYAHTINTTESLSEFKSAFDGIRRILGKDSLFGTPANAAKPTRTPRKRASKTAAKPQPK